VILESFSLGLIIFELIVIIGFLWCLFSLKKRLEQLIDKQNVNIENLMQAFKLLVEIYYLQEKRNGLHSSSQSSSTRDEK